MPKADTRKAKIKHAKSKIKEKNKFTKKRNNAFPESSEQKIPRVHNKRMEERLCKVVDIM